MWGVYFHAVVGEIVANEVGEDEAMASDFIERLPALQRRLRKEINGNDVKSNQS